MLYLIKWWTHSKIRLQVFFTKISIIYESFGVGLLTELSGKIDTAEEIFKAILEDNPINRDAIETLAEFKKRNNIE